MDWRAGGKRIGEWKNLFVRCCYTPESEHTYRDEMAMQFRHPFEIMLPGHMEHGAAEVVP